MTLRWTLILNLLGAADLSTPPPADLILLEARIHTMDAARPRAEAVAVRGGRFVHVGDSAGAMALRGPSTQVRDLGGATVLPGLTDAHGHVAGLGFAMERLDFTGTRSAEAIAEQVRLKAASTPPGTWIRGRGWDQNDWERKEFPSSRLLDEAAPRHPVALDRVDGHAVWVNGSALHLAGVTRHTPDPPGGRILRDESGGPSGVLVDAAEGLVTSRIPPPTREQTRAALQRGMRRCLESGLTSVHDAGVSAGELEVYRELLVDGDFPFRVYAMLADDAELVRDRLSRPPEIGLGDGRLTVRAVKLYMDGALGSRGARLLRPYADEPSTSGLSITAPARLEDLTRGAARAGFQLCVHAIGDRGNREALDAFERGLGEAARGGHRFRIEHAQVLDPADVPRLAALRVIASMQPTHATSDMPWAEARLGPERLAGAYAWRSLIDSGARVACGSDFPHESESPLLGLWAAVTRQDPDGRPPDGWLPRQRMTREQAVRCFTVEAAYAAFEEETRGSIAPGRLADMTVLSEDVLQGPVRRILDAQVLMTIVGGRIAYEKP